VLDGFGRAVLAASRYVAPRTVDELADILSRARAEGLGVTFRGAGRSYGDASLGTGQLAVDTTGLDRMLSWDPVRGIAEVEPGLTVEGLWRRTLEDGYWPHVVPGTMRPTIGGCVSMNIHGKNNFIAGPFGDHVLDVDLLTPSGERVLLSRESNPDLFRAVIGGAGLLGAVTRVRLQLKRVESGLLRVEPISTPTFDAMVDCFEERVPRADYLVGWVDCMSEGAGLGRGQIHQANYLHADEDPQGRESLHVERQGLPSSILGVPKKHLWRFMQFLTNDTGIRLLNAAKYHASRLARPGKTFLQSHVGFAFLLDYVPDWRLAYGRSGFIQIQVFVPKQAVREVIPAILRLGQKREIMSYLGVFKRHRPDEFLLSHALDGYSFAMDYPVNARNREALWALGREINDLVADAGGRFYLAKDALCEPAQILRAYGDRIERFFALKRRLDPEGLFASDQARRLFPDRFAA
jgi:FAD/FMN-containing dehydrogenase